MFYLLSLVILFWALSDVRDAQDGEFGVIYISSYQAAVLFGSYCVYVVVCANFNKWFGIVETIDNKESSDYVRDEAFEVSIPVPEFSDVSLSLSLFIEIV